MNRSHRLLALALGAGLLACVAMLPSRSAAAPLRHAASARGRANTVTLTIMTNSGMMAGLTKATAGTTQGTVSSWYHYYGALWHKAFPNVTIHEIQVPSMADEATKTILEVNAGNPPDLIGTDEYLGQLVARHAVMNLDAFYRRAGITARYFLPSEAAQVRVLGHWYAMPGASNPSDDDLLYIPKFVKAAGWDPNKIPRTWDQLWTATQKVTKWDSKGNLVRIGVEVGGEFSNPDTDQINEFCGYFATYDPKTARFHANLPCIKADFRYELRLLKFYGGVAKYTKFISGDPTVWSCSKKAYIPTGKIIFALDAYWSGGQMDTCYNVDWRLSWAPTPHGTMAELRAVHVPTWVMLIPRGAKHPQLAFDFIKFTDWEHGDLMGPTTNGFVVAGQGEKWAQTFSRVEGQIRASHHYPGNPMADALKVVIKESELGQVLIPTDVANSYYDTQMSRAWQEVEYGRATIDQALDQAQRLIDNQQRVLHEQFGNQ
jgi:ABC-type glycerol-3-phosphate transport system substrate-binding protein